nr:hypothetical protein [Tanacetum cinerariifolium]
IEFPLAEEVPTASEEGCHCQKKKKATARKIALLSKSRRNCQSKSNDSFTKLGLVSNRLAELTPSFRGVKKSNKHDEDDMVQRKCKLGDGHFTAAIKVLTASGVASVVAHDLLGSITEVVNLFLSGKCPIQLVEYIASAPLTPLVKPGGGIRPIAVGTVWRRLVSKVASSPIGNFMNTYLQDFQFGVGILGGCEAVLHFVNRLIESKGTKFGSSMLLVDFKNAFNLIDMGILLEETRAWYLNDITIVGDTLMVAKALDIIMIDALARELFFNVDKTELFWPVGDPRSRAGDVFPINVSHPVNGVKFLGALVSVHEGFCQDLALKRVSKTISLMEAFHKLHDPQCELLILCNYVGVAKLSYALRTCYPMSLLEAQVQFDQALCTSLERVVTASGPGFGDWQWRLATLPIKFGGLGILSAGDIICMLLMLSTLHVTSTCSLSPLALMPPYDENFGKVLHSCPHAQDFLFTIIIDGLGQRTNHHQFRSVLCYRLAVPKFSEGSLCSSCNEHWMDQRGDHAVHCSSEVGVKFRPNLVRDILIDICSKVGIMVCKEAPMGFLSDDRKDLRPVDLLLFN